MTPDDVRWLAQKVVARAFHAVSDASVEALAKRVLELEQHEVALSESLQQMVDRLGDAEAEREACAELCDADSANDDYSDTWQRAAQEFAHRIRARGLRSTPTLDDVKRGGA
jgi:hypothetical protein